MIPWPPHLYRSIGEQQNVSPELADSALEQALAVQKNGLPAILTLKHLSLMTGASYEYLRKIISRARNPYTSFRVGKRKGGFRIIVSPERDLRVVQRWISDNILRPLSERHCHEASYAYSPKSSIIKCATQHINCKWLIKIDLVRFFESISEIDIYHIFNSAGYQSLVSFELARICTRLVPVSSPFIVSYLKKLHRPSINKWRSLGHYYTIRGYENNMIGHLPQGAPSSPMLANLRMISLDLNLDEFAIAHGMKYTRYSDDLCFSTVSNKFNRDSARNFINSIYGILTRRGFSANLAKTVIAPPGSRKVVLGLLVDGNSLHLPRPFKDRIRQHLFYLRKSKTVTQHAQIRHFRTVSGMLAHIRGLIDYARQVEPVYGNAMLDEYEKILSEKSCVPSDLD